MGVLSINGVDKECIYCHTVKPLSEFNIRKNPYSSNKIYYRSECKSCGLIKQKPSRVKYREKNREKLRLAGRIYMKKRLLGTDYRDSLKPYRKKYYQLNKSKLNKNRVKYAKENPKGRASAFRHRQKRNGIILQFEKIKLSDLSKLYENSKDLCFYCGEKLNGKFEYDHYVPLSKNGTHTIENLRISCKACNRSKRDKMPEEFIKILNAIKSQEVGYRVS